MKTYFINYEESLFIASHTTRTEKIQYIYLSTIIQKHLIYALVQQIKGTGNMITTNK